MSEPAGERLAADVHARWTDHTLDLTVSLSGALVPTAQALREIQRAIPGTVRVAVLRLLPSEAEPPGEAADERELALIEQAFDWTADPSYVSVAVLRGVAGASAVRLALGCDLRVVTTDAVLTAPPLAAWALARAVGYPLALELAVTGRRLDAAEALGAGLAQQLVAPEGLDRTVESLVADLLSADRDTAREIKALLLGAEKTSREGQRSAERAAQLRRLLVLRESGGGPPAD